ncbi:MAG TPA: hypothetical protein VK898_20200, partial [Chloroflexota bacterium]|nr:hypothetical protein [Chloroflexota bacterium]
MTGRARGCSVLAVVVLVCAAGCVAAPAPVAEPTAVASTEPVATPTPLAPGEPTLEPTAAPSVVVGVPTLQVGPDAPRPPNAETVPVPSPGSCRIVDGLPDHGCTPGALNPRLTPAQLCAPGFSTRTIRPPSSYTDALKKRVMVSYGQVGVNPLTGRSWSPTDVELDHAVSLEDLGHPWSPLNLWPQPRRATGAEPNAEEKDAVEVTVRKLICADQSHAADYAARLAADWTQFRRTLSLAETTP